MPAFLREFLLKSLWWLVRYVAACALFAFVLYLLWLVFVFIPEYDIALPNGYVIVKGNRHEIGISIYPKYKYEEDKKCKRIDSEGKIRHNGIIVGGKITQYAVVGDIVCGENINSPLHPDPETEIGYFVLDTKNDICYLGLDRTTFQNQLIELGISPIQINMKEPGPFDKQYAKRHSLAH